MYKKNFHTNFKLNNISFASANELIAYSKTISFSISTFLEDWFSEELTINVQTSGSTGKPKTIALKKEYMINSAKATGTFFDLKEKTTALLCLSTDYIAGKMMLVRAMVLGWRLDMVKVGSNPLLNNDKTYDFCAMVPMQVHHSLPDLHKINKLIIGGGAVDNNLLKKIKSLKTEIFATYGMTETITHIAVKRLNGFRHAAPKRRGVSASYYKTLPHIKVSNDKRNCLVVKAPKITDDKIITSDLVKIISDTEFEWLGRVDNIINSGGVKLIPEQIEGKLATILNQRFFVAGVFDEILGEKLVLIVENQESRIKNQDLELKIKNLATLKKYEIPKEIYFVENFVETATKKIQRQQTLDSVFSKD